MTPSDPGAYALDTKAVRHVADLARLRVEDEEMDGLVKHFGAILEHFNVLSAAGKEGRLDLDAVDPFLFSDTEIPPAREDVPIVSSVREDVLGSAPRRKDSFFVVPRILGQHGGEGSSSPCGEEGVSS